MASFSAQHLRRDSLQFDLRAMASEVEEWANNLKANMLDVGEQIGQAWQAGAVKRVPRDEGTTAAQISHRVGMNSAGTTVVIEVGVPAENHYAPHIEFGTIHIAGGAVKALGLSDEITDAEAITDWPAKRAEATDETSFEAGAEQEQMPWLRPAFSAIADQAVDLIWRAAGVE